MLHIDDNICDLHATVTYLTLLLPGQPANYYYCHYFTFILFHLTNFLNSIKPLLFPRTISFKGELA